MLEDDPKENGARAKPDRHQCERAPDQQAGLNERTDEQAKQPDARNCTVTDTKRARGAVEYRHRQPAERRDEQ
jgi:hypothetical protein